MRASIYILGIFSLAALFVAVLSLCVWFVPGDYYHDLAALVNKRDTLESRSAPRLIFIGGSSLATLRSPEIERAINRKSRLNRPVINLGLWGGLSIERYLDTIFPLLKSGDVVVISQEYATLLDRGYFRYIRTNDEARRFFFLMSPCPSIAALPADRNLVDAASDVTMLNQLKIKTYLALILDVNFRHSFTGGYYRYALQYNAFGDRIRPFRVTRPLNSAGVRFEEPNQANIIYLKEFNERARYRGIHVFFAFPPFPEPDYRLNQVQISDLEILLRKKFGLAVLNSPRDAVYPESCFADTVNHLTPPCEVLRSDSLTRRLAPLLREANDRDRFFH